MALGLSTYCSATYASGDCGQNKKSRKKVTHFLLNFIVRFNQWLKICLLSKLKKTENCTSNFPYFNFLSKILPLIDWERNNFSWVGIGKNA